MALISVGFLVFLSAVCAVCFVRQPEAENIETKENQIYAGQQYTSVQMIPPANTLPPIPRVILPYPLS